MNKLLIIGHARHGKDTVAELLKEYYGLKYQSSSYACAEIFIYDALKDKYGYQSFQECFDDRVNHRAEWYEMIKEYNKNDRAKLAKEILAKGYDCYVGMREREEILECIKQNVFDLIIWVDASDRLALENSDSFNITKDLADVIIDNNGPVYRLKNKMKRFGNILFPATYRIGPEPNSIESLINSIHLNSIM